jgi:hypothetical protein
VSSQVPEDETDRTILHADYEYDPFCDDEVFGPEQISSVIVNEDNSVLFQVPALQQHQVIELKRNQACPTPLIFFDLRAHYQ